MKLVLGAFFCILASSSTLVWADCGVLNGSLAELSKSAPEETLRDTIAQTQEACRKKPVNKENVGELIGKIQAHESFQNIEAKIKEQFIAHAEELFGEALRRQRRGALRNIPRPNNPVAAVQEMEGMMAAVSNEKMQPADLCPTGSDPTKKKYNNKTAPTLADRMELDDATNFVRQEFLYPPTKVTEGWNGVTFGNNWKRHYGQINPESHCSKTDNKTCVSELKSFLQQIKKLAENDDPARKQYLRDYRDETARVCEKKNFKLPEGTTCQDFAAQKATSFLFLRNINWMMGQPAATNPGRRPKEKSKYNWETKSKEWTNQEELAEWDYQKARYDQEQKLPPGSKSNQNSLLTMIHFFVEGGDLKEGSKKLENPLFQGEKVKGLFTEGANDNTKAKTLIREITKAALGE